MEFTKGARRLALYQESFLQNHQGAEDKNFLGHVMESVVAQMTSAEYFFQTTQQEEIFLGLES